LQSKYQSAPCKKHACGCYSLCALYPVPLFSKALERRHICVVATPK